MQIHWDNAKARSNAKKHGVRFSEAIVALGDEAAITILDPDAQGEDRFVSVGMDERNRLLVTVLMYRGDSIRIISSRRASAKERKLYQAT